jgi:hypothetical protein
MNEIVKNVTKNKDRKDKEYNIAYCDDDAVLIEGSENNLQRLLL